MSDYVTRDAIRAFRLRQNLTQAELAASLNVSDKVISKWETGRSLPDITLLEPLAAALHVSLSELMSGEAVVNLNRSANLLRSCFCVCPVCGNIIHSTGSAQVSCCGITLPPLEAESFDEAHLPAFTPVEDEFFAEIPHEMSKRHYISFMAKVTGDRLELVKLYPEGNAEARFKVRGHGLFYAYCNIHGLMKCRI